IDATAVHGVAVRYGLHLNAPLWNARQPMDDAGLMRKDGIAGIRVFDDVAPIVGSVGDPDFVVRTGLGRPKASSGQGGGQESTVRDLAKRHLLAPCGGCIDLNV